MAFGRRDKLMIIDSSISTPSCFIYTFFPSAFLQSVGKFIAFSSPSPFAFPIDLSQFPNAAPFSCTCLSCLYQDVKDTLKIPCIVLEKLFTLEEIKFINLLHATYGTRGAFPLTMYSTFAHFHLIPHSFLGNISICF